MKKIASNNSWSSMAALIVAAVAAGLFVMGPTPASGQPPAKGGEVPAKGGKEKAPPAPVPRTKDGKPDMSGFWNGVTPGGNVNIEPAAAKGGAPKGDGAPKGGPGGPGGPGGGKGGPPPAGGPAVAGGPGAGKGPGGPAGGAPGGAAPGAAAAKGKAKGVIVDPEDARVPYTAAARALSDGIIANRMFLEPELHCYPSGVPHNMWVQFGMQIIQNKDHLMFMWEFMHSRRIIPLDGRPLQFPASVRQLQGESSGKWEGDTLVVTTKNQTNRTWLDTSGHYAPEDLEVVERFTMVNANTINYEATATSAKEFTQPMKLVGAMSRAQANDPSYEQMEFACIEGNQDLLHYTDDVGGGAKNVGPLKQ